MAASSEQEAGRNGFWAGFGTGAGIGATIGGTAFSWTGPGAAIAAGAGALIGGIAGGIAGVGIGRAIYNRNEETREMTVTIARIEEQAETQQVEAFAEQLGPILWLVLIIGGLFAVISVVRSWRRR